MKIAIGCDHGGFEHKNAIAEHIVYNWEETPTQSEIPTTMPSDPVGEFAIEESYEIEDSEECPF